MSRMRFKSIEVHRFRQFRDECAVHDLSPELNVIAGNNEAGKSTLLRAVRAALFDRYTSTVGESFRPYDADVSPGVCLVFDVDGVEYRLTKVFSRRRDGQATLEASDGRRWEGAGAEDHLAGLLGFSYAGRGGSRAELQGLAGLLWVEQAKAYEPVTPTEEFRGQVHAVFETEVRELLGGDHGEALHRRIAELHKEFFDVRGNPRGDYKRLREHEQQLQKKLGETRQELGAYEEKVDRLEERQKEFNAYLEDKTLEKAQKRVRLAKEAAKRMMDLKASVETGTVQLGRATAELQAAEQQSEARAKLMDEVEQARQAQATAAQAMSEKEVELSSLAEGLSRMQRELAGATSRKQVIDAELRSARGIEALGKLAAERDSLKTAVRDAQQADAERRRCLAERDAIRATEQSVSGLKAVERARDLARERLNAAATRIEHRLAPGAAVDLGGEPLVGEGSKLLTRKADLRVDGVGEFAVIPGGEDLDVLRRKVEEESRRLVQGLAELGADSVAGAETLLRRREKLDSKASQQAATLDGLAPHGLPALEDRSSLVAAQMDKLRTELGEDAGGDFDIEALEREVETLQRRIAASERDVSREEKRVQSLRESVAESRAEKAAAERLAGGRGADLEQARRDTADEHLAESLGTARLAFAEKTRELEAAQQALDAARPEAVEMDVERSERALNDIRREIETLDRDIRDLKVELAALGQKGLAEEAASVEAEHALAVSQLENADRRARALDLLQRTFDDALKSAKQAVARPVTAKLLPYLRQLIPDAAPSVDEELSLAGIVRAGAAEAFADLSIGTREQLAVLIRLAYADLLSEAGKPVTVILDDALVNSDDDRRERMKAILYQAAKRYQILLLTCHGREYRDTGGAFLRLEERVGDFEGGTPAP